MSDFKIKVKKFLDKHEKLKYLQKVTFGFFEKDFRNIVNSSFNINDIIFNKQTNKQTNKCYC